LRSTPTPATVRPYQVSVIGRWAEIDATRPTAPSVHAHAAAPGGAAPVTPMAGRRVEFDLEDADGRRRAVLQAVVPGRRYVVGKGESCDIRVNATYASRRHAELWLDNGAWWVADAGSTNGLRVEAAGRTLTSADGQPLVLTEGARLVLSARAEGPAGEYPWLVLRAPVAAARITPIAAAASVAAAPKTPLTAVHAPAPDALAYRLSAVLNSGVRTLELRAAALPVSIGRSRNQTLVVDRHHEGVSGHHLDLTELDDAGVQVVVHGSNGVLVDGTLHGPGMRFRWSAGQTLVLGASPDDHPPCRLTLER
jgi:pSer/pThr/pTyr-binding forkhead associated (FHA) protein